MAYAFRFPSKRLSAKPLHVLLKRLDRLNKELRRRLDVVGRHPDEHGCLSLISGVAIKYAAQQKGFSVGDMTQQLWLRLRSSKVAMLERLLLYDAE